MASDCTNTPMHIWMASVIEQAKVEDADLKRQSSGRTLRARLHTWYGAGESVESAARDVAFYVKEHKRAVAAYNETKGLRVLVRNALSAPDGEGGAK